MITADVGQLTRQILAGLKPPPRLRLSEYADEQRESAPDTIDPTHIHLIGVTIRMTGAKCLNKRIYIYIDIYIYIQCYMIIYVHIL